MSLSNVWTEHISSTGTVVAGTRRQLTCGLHEVFPTLTWNGSRAGLGFVAATGSDISTASLDNGVLLFP